MHTPDSATGIDRRRFLRLAGSGLLAASVPAGSAAAADSEFPLRAEGTRIIRFVPAGESYRKLERFVSSDLAERYGSATVEYDPEPVDARHVPDEYRNPDRAFTLEFDDVAVVGTWDEHVTAERHLREGANASGDIEAQSHTPSYWGPFYAYKSSSLAERSAPINVAWRRYLGLDAGEVKTKMLNNGWGSIIPSSDRYALLYDGSSWYAQKQVNHIRKPTGFTDQWHCRTWNLSYSMDDDYRVAVQAHHDPWDHGYLGGSDWQFSESRQTVLDTWDGISSYYTANTSIGNGGDFPSSNGLLGVVW